MINANFMITWQEIQDNDYNTSKTTSHFIQLDASNSFEDILADIKEIADNITRTEKHAGDCIIKDAKGRVVCSRAVRFGQIEDEDRATNSDILKLSDFVWFEDWREGDGAECSET